MKKISIPHTIPILVLIGLCIAIISLVSSLSDTTRRKNMLKTRQKALLELQTKNQELQKQLQIVQSPEFVEREARNKLNFAKSGDTIILIGQDIKTNIHQPIQPVPLKNWKKWWDLFFY